MKSRSVRGFVSVGVLLLGVAASAAAERARAGRANGRAERAATRGPELVLAYHAAGVRDAGTAATVVLCTNLGPGDTVVQVEFYDFDGAFLCAMAGEVFPGETWTWATRQTVLYGEDGRCTDDEAPAPLAEQGSVDILVTAQTKLLCTVQVIDPTAATPVYATTLELFRP
jgi:hypothetical protein